MGLSYSIRAAAEKSGLSAHTIRAWERRYGVLSPHRTETNRRVYDEADLARLVLLRRAVAAGHSIGHVAALSNEDLLRLASTNPLPTSNLASQHLEACLTALNELNADALHQAVRRATAILGVDQLLSEVIAPLLVQVGHDWQSNELGMSREHLVSAVLRSHLDQIRSSFTPPPGAPRIIVTTPAGQRHEFGALMASIAAARESWKVYYLGPDLPADQIAKAARQTNATAVALSLVYPMSQHSVELELLDLRNHVGASVPILVGGPAAESYAVALNKIGAVLCPDMTAMRTELNRLTPKFVEN